MPFPYQNSTNIYKIGVKTGKHATDGQVFIKLIGECGESPEHLLTKQSNVYQVKRFQPNSTNNLYPHSFSISYTLNKKTYRRETIYKFWAGFGP